MDSSNEYRDEREHMVTRHLQSRDITDTRVLDAMRQVPREQFVHHYLKSDAYFDGPLPIGSGQTISQPYIVALMIAALDLQAADTVLEIGTGSGYAAAVLSVLCRQVYTIERIDELSCRARKTLRRLGYNNVEVITGDGTLGWPEAAPFDAIVVAAGGPKLPPPLKQQLAVGGRLVMPVGKQDHTQSLVCVTRTGIGQFRTEDLCSVRFVPLFGAEGWPALNQHPPEDPPRRKTQRE